MQNTKVNKNTANHMWRIVNKKWDVNWWPDTYSASLHSHLMLVGAKDKKCQKIVVPNLYAVIFFIFFHRIQKKEFPLSSFLHSISKNVEADSRLKQYDSLSARKSTKIIIYRWSSEIAYRFKHVGLLHTENSIPFWARNNADAVFINFGKKNRSLYK